MRAMSALQFDGSRAALPEREPEAGKSCCCRRRRAGGKKRGAQCCRKQRGAVRFLDFHTQMLSFQLQRAQVNARTS